MRAYAFRRQRPVTPTRIWLERARGRVARGEAGEAAPRSTAVSGTSWSPNFEGYKRAIEIANRPNVGVCLCCGSWLEGGTMTGADPVQMIKYFGGIKKLFKIHFRNVSAPLPHFTETLIDMSNVMQALVDVDFNGIVIPDHIPAMGIIPGADNRELRRACSRSQTGIRVRTIQGSPPQTSGRESIPGKSSSTSRTTH
jgi:hypothetical protein